MFILALFSILSLILSLTFAQDTKLEEVKEAFDNADVSTANYGQFHLSLPISLDRKKRDYHI